LLFSKETVLRVSLKRTFSLVGIGEKMVEIKAKNRTRFFSLIAVILVLCISLSVFASFELNAQAPILPQKINSLTETTRETPTPTFSPSAIPMPIPVDFTCNARSAYAFNVTVYIDLNDGMDQTEAKIVAEAIINHELISAVHEFKSANVSDSGIWTVNFSWGAIRPDGSQESLGHYFDVTINVSDRTVTYDRCY
jgi:hypothetical protein